MQTRNLACFLVVVAVALAWRFVGLTHDSLWLDESYQSIADAYGQPLPNFFQVPAQPFIYKPTRAATPPQMLAHFRSIDPLTPPLYQLLLNRWIAAFGGSDATVRSLSVVISTAGAGALFWLGTALLGWRAGLCAGLLQAFSPFDVYYGQEVRMYGLEELAAILSCGSLLLFLLRIDARGRMRLPLLVLYAVATWAVINTHYTGLFLVAFEVLLAAAVLVVARDWKRLTAFVCAGVAALLMWVPWFGLFKQAAAVRTASFYVARNPSLSWPFYALCLRIPANWVIFLTGKHVAWFAAPLYVTSVLLLLLVPLLWLPLPVVRARFNKIERNLWLGTGSTQGERRQRVVVIVLLAWAIVPAVILWLIDVVENHRVVEIARYVISTAPAVYLLVGAAVSALNWKSRFAWALVAAQLAFSGLNVVSNATMYHEREPWREMAQLVEATVPQDQLLLVSQYYDIVCLDRYLSVPYRQVGVSSQTTTQQLIDILHGAPEFALVTAQEGDRVVQAVPTDYYITRQWDLGHSLHLLLYARH